MPHMLSYLLIGLFGLLTMAFEPVMAAGTSDETAESEAAPSYTAAKAMIDAEDFTAALPILAQLTADQPDNADAWNLYGFANRKLGNMELAATSYETALKLNPAHLGALEYQGEMFIETGMMDAAKGNLTKLQGLCGTCEEAGDLAAAIDASS